MDAPHVIRERSYTAVVEAISPILEDFPPKIVAIDGRPGIGKTSLGRFLSHRFNSTLTETDLFLIEGQGKYVYRNDEIDRIIDYRLRSDRPVIIEGVTTLRLLASLNRSADFLGSEPINGDDRDGWKPGV